jgi:STE24 endopeptidase
MTSEPKKNMLNQVEKAKAYQRRGLALSLAGFLFSVAFMFLLLASGLTFDLRDLAASFGGGPTVWVIVYLALAGLAYKIISAPLAVLRYRLEKNFDLLNQSWRGWAWDRLKAGLLGFVLGIVAVETLFLFFRIAGGWWWVPAGAVFALFFILLAHLAPVAILPLFFKFQKLPENDLTRRLSELCHEAGVPVMGIYEWGLAAKTRRANAALVGFGSTRRVVLSDTLLKEFTPSEIEVVLGHELGHHVLRHIPILMTLQIVLTFIGFFLADLIYYDLGPELYLTSIADPAGLPLLGLIFTNLSLAAMPLANGISRRLEARADDYALKLTGLAGSFISAMERLTALNLAELEPHPAVEFLLHGHPAPSKRISAAKDFRRGQRGPNDAVH